MPTKGSVKMLHTLRFGQSGARLLHAQKNHSQNKKNNKQNNRGA